MTPDPSNPGRVDPVDRADPVDALDIVALTRSLVDLDSTTGREGDVAQWLAAFLRRLGYAVSEQRVDGERFNVLATVGTPRVTLSTHLDCVPPFFPSRVDSGRIFGRGSCDAKGIVAAQVAASERLRVEGETGVGLLFVVGEERGSDGARVANGAAPGSAYLINGEPTDCRLGLATRGAVRLKLGASGRAAHSGYPELGVSAIDTLIDALAELRSAPLPDDPILGRTHYTVGIIKGGVAPNVVSPEAEAELMFRTVSDAANLRSAIAAHAARKALGSSDTSRDWSQRVTFEWIFEVPPVRLMTLPGFDSAVFSYTTDIPFLGRWGQPLLYGPGSIHVAHTDEESVAIDELHTAVNGYVRLARELLSRPS